MPVRENPATDAKLRANRQGLEPSGEPTKIGIHGAREQANDQLRSISGIASAKRIDQTTSGKEGVEQSKRPALRAPNRPGKRK